MPNCRVEFGTSGHPVALFGGRFWMLWWCTTLVLESSPEQRPARHGHGDLQTSFFGKGMCRVNCSLIIPVMNRMFHSTSALFIAFKIVSVGIISSVVQEGPACRGKVLLCLERGRKWICGNSFHTPIYLSASLQIIHMFCLQLCSTLF